MKAILPFFALIICASWTHAQRCKKTKGNGNVVTAERKVGNYEGITEGGFYEVTLVEGEEGNITLST